MADGVLFGGKEKPARLIGGEVRVREDFENGEKLPVKPFTGTVQSFDEPTRTYMLALAAPLQNLSGVPPSLRIRSDSPGHPLSSLGRWQRTDLAVEVELPILGWVPARASIWRYPRSALCRRFVLPVLVILFGLGALLHGAMTLYRDLRIHDFGQRATAHVESAHVVESSSDPKPGAARKYEVCYELFVPARGRFYGPDWYRDGAGCVAVSEQTYREASASRYVAAWYDPEHPRFNRLTQVDAAGNWQSLLLLMGGLGLVGYGLFEARR